MTASIVLGQVRRGRYLYDLHRVEVDGSLTCWGPTNTDPNGRRGWRTFRAEDVHEVTT